MQFSSISLWHKNLRRAENDNLVLGTVEGDGKMV